MKGISTSPRYINLSQEQRSEKRMRLMDEQPVLNAEEFNPLYINFMKKQYLAVDTDYTYA